MNQGTEKEPRGRGPDVSIVVPLFNEEENVKDLYDALVSTLRGTGKYYEIIFVDDGSKDKTFEILDTLRKKDRFVKVIKLKKNFGQTPGLAAGIDHAEGKIIITMDGDMQHDPSDIPFFLDKMKEGYDIVSGWREKRVDSFFFRRLPSMIANRIMAILSGVDLHDFGTTFKAYRKDIIKGVELYGELHRFIPALASGMGARIVEIPIKNIVRERGTSSYGLSRTFRVIFDIILVKFLISFSTRPLQFFGLFGGISFLAGSLFGTYLLVKKIVLGTSIFLEHGPLLFLASLLIIFGVQIITFGLLAEMLTRIYHNTRNIKIYHVESVLEGGDE